MNTEATHDQQEKLTTGVRLRNAREQLGLSQQAVAERLCLKLTTVRDLEEDKNPTELASTFLRGYIRSYARLVHIPEEELLPMIEQQIPTRAAKVILNHGYALGKQHKKRDGWLMSFTWLVLFVVVGLTGAWWWQNHKVQQAEITSMVDHNSAEQSVTEGQSVPLNTGSAAPTEGAVDVPLQSPAAAPAPEATAPVATANTQNNTVVPPSQAPVETAAPAATAPTTEAPLPTADAGVSLPAADANALVMNFSADCWLEVTDGSGKKLFSGMQRSGATLNLAGQAPYRLKIGAPSAVQIQFQGQPVDLSRFIRNNQVARLTLNAEQSAAQ